MLGKTNISIIKKTPLSILYQEIENNTHLKAEKKTIEKTPLSPRESFLERLFNPGLSIANELLSG